MSTSKLQQAVLFATQSHFGDDREGPAPLPYITHPMEVLINLRYIGEVADEEMLCAAALHDVIEESSIKLGEIGQRFGSRVETLVKELTRREPTAEETSGLTKDEIWNLRAGILVEEIEAMSFDAKAIKLADRLANVREAKLVKKGKKLTRYLDQTKKILKVVDRTVNPNLWNAIQSEL
jgi:(p)ppGpp synthase/HD superfamily hydrolase